MDLRAAFNGWELAFGQTPGSAENAWSTAPTASEGLLVDGLVDADIEALPAATSLLVYRGRLSKSGLAALVSRLHALACVDCEFVGGFEAIADSPLKQFWLRNTDAIDASVLMPIVRATALVELYLDSVAPVALLPCLAPMTSLRRLDISRPFGFREVGRSLAALRPLAALEQLGLRRAYLSEDVLAHVAALPALRRLDFSLGTNLAPAKAWLQLAQIEELHLAGVRGVTQIVATLGELKSLRLLDLRGAEIDATLVERLRNALPNTHIQSDPPKLAVSVALPSRPIPAAPSHPARFPEDAPPLADLHIIIPGDRGEPEGFEIRQDLATVATRFDPARIIATLGSADAATEEALVALMLLLPAVRHYDPNAGRLTDPAIEAAVRLLGDERTAVWKWGDIEWKSYRFVVAGLAAATLLELQRWRAERRET